MSCRSLVVCGVVASFMTTLSAGCGEGTDVKLAHPDIKTIEIRMPPPTKDPKKGGGITSKDSNRDPGASN